MERSSSVRPAVKKRSSAHRFALRMRQAAPKRGWGGKRLSTKGKRLFAIRKKTRARPVANTRVCRSCALLLYKAVIDSVEDVVFDNLVALDDNPRSRSPVNQDCGLCERRFEKNVVDNLHVARVGYIECAARFERFLARGFLFEDVVSENHVFAARN